MKISWKKGQILPTFDYTITVLNKLRAKDSKTKIDIWKKTVLSDCFWSEKAVRTVQGTSVSLGNSYIVRVPKNDNFKPYNKWKNGMEGFTFSTGDYIILGEIGEETVTPNTIQTVVNKYRPNAFEIKIFKDNTGTIEAAEHYRIEGV